MSDGDSIPPEGPISDKKSLRGLLRDSSGIKQFLKDLAKDVVCFANARGGTIFIGIEDEDDQPPPGQRLPEGAVARVQKGLLQNTENVRCAVESCASGDGDEYMVVYIERAEGVASTKDGRYFLRVVDECRPITGNDIARLLQDRPATRWEQRTGLQIGVDSVERGRLHDGLRRVREAGKLGSHLAQKTDRELAEYLGFVDEGLLTNLGVLFLGTPAQRRRLGTAPTIDVIHYDDERRKVRKETWADHSHTPAELVDLLWNGIPDFRESYEFPAGLFRTSIPAYEEEVVREILVNALVHRSYDHGGEILVELHPDRMVVTSPGRLPLGVTVANILHASRRRNESLALVFQYLGLMEREGSGVDLVFDRILASGRPAPVFAEGADFVRVEVGRRVMYEGVLELIAEADRRYQLLPRERIALGLLAQTDGLRAEEFASRLGLPSAAEARPWFSRLLELGLIESSGQRRGTRYFVPPAALERSGLGVSTTLTHIEPHRLRELLLEDLRHHPESLVSDIRARIGAEIDPARVKKSLRDLRAEGLVESEGKTRGTRYRLVLEA